MVNFRVQKSCRSALTLGPWSLQGRSYFAAASLFFLVPSADLHAGNLTRSGVSNSTSGGAAAATSQTTTAATTATTQTSQAAILAQRAQISLQRSVLSLQAIQAQQTAQSAARNLAIGAGSSNNLGTSNQSLLNVPDGLVMHGLVPGIQGVDATNPVDVATTVPVTVNANGSSSVTLAANTAITLPTSVAGNTQITVSGTGTIGTVTTGGTITPLTAGVTTSVAPGSTISLTAGETVTFASGSAAIPSSFLTFNYASATATNPVLGSWSGIGGLTQSTYAPSAGQTSGQTTVSVTQTAQQALLTWQTFNIGKNTILDFDQSQGGANVGQWVAINKVAANIAPSQVLGAIQAPGQVYVINQNGIIFGGSSQVNVGALVASSLPINDNLVSRGLLNDPDFQFLFSQLDLPAGTQGPTAAFTPQGTASAPGSAPAPGSYGTSGGLISQVDSSGNLSLVHPTGQDGDVVVQAGARLGSPTTPENVGGRIALIGPNVNNAGTISSPNGQTILAAGLEVGLAAHPGADPTLRGLDVSIGAVSDPTYDNGASGVSGTATNGGLIEISQADLTIAGEYVNQNAVVDSSTSVSLNGRVDLLADYNAVPLINGINGFQGTSNFYPTASGVVTLGANSLTQILPELSNTATEVGTQLALSSLVNIQAGSIDMGPSALLLAPSANLPSDSATPAFGIDGVALTAGVTLDAGSWLLQTNGSYNLDYTSGQVYLDSGATIDVSGSENVSASVAENIISAQLLGTELANSPLQQNGPLRGATIEVDIRQTGNYNGTEWVGTPIGDISGYVNLIGRTVGELTTAGGTVAINAGTSTVMKQGATVDVSGGWINYQGAMVQTTQVVANGLAYDISQATPNLVYDGIYTGYTTSSTKWGISRTYSNSIQSGAKYEAGYIQGGNGGSIAISSPAMALDGTLLGTTVAGPNQRTAASQVESTFSGTTVAPTMVDIFGVPTSSTLTLAFQAQNPANPSFPEYSPTAPNVVFESSSSLPASGAFGAALPQQRLNEVDLSPDLVNTNGFGNLNITDSDGNITVPSNISLTTAAGGSITMLGANIDIEGNVASPGGTLSFTAYDFSPYATPLSTPSPDPTRGKFTLGASATLSAAGLVVDDRPASPGAGTAPMITSGGKVTINAYDVDLASGNQARDAVNVSGGVYVSTAGKITYGNGGSIAVEAGQDPLQLSILGGQLVWNPNLAQLVGYSGAVGGALTVKAPLIQIGGSVLLNGDSTASGDTLWLDQTDISGNLLEPDFFSQGGFTSFTLNGIGEAVLDSGGNLTGQYLPGTLIAPNTQIVPEAQGWQASFKGSQILFTTDLLPLGLRTPVNLAFNDSGVKDPFLGKLLVRGDFVLDAGVVIRLDPETTASNGVSINANTVAVLGSIIAPGGTISIAGGGNSTALFTSPVAVPTVDLGPDSLLSTAGAVNLVPNALGYSTGTVLTGGTIKVSGNIVAETGAVLNVSGTSGVLDVPPSEAGLATNNLGSSSIPVATRIDSNGGSIILTGSQELFTDATLLGAAGGLSAQGGSLSISSGILLSTGFQTPLDPTLVVTQDGRTIPVPSYYPAGQTAIGNAVVDVNGNVLPQNGYFAANSFISGSFSSLDLEGTVQFVGPVTITANQSLMVGDAGVIFANSTVNLNAPYVALGMPFQSPLPVGQQTSIFQADGGALYFSPTYGGGTLNVTASLIDVGNLSMQGIGNVNLTAINGDIRGDGTLDVAGSISLTAGQIYPTTDNIFTIAAYDYNGVAGDSSITISASGSRQLPFSAGGELNIYASNIVQSGVLVAPVGIINLGSGVTGAVPIDYLTGSGVAGITPTDVIPATQSLTLTSGSVTSVSAVDPITGQALQLPYGTNVNGVTWTDPAGNDITLAGNGSNAIPAKSINISANNVADQSGATISISGGGDIYSYSFVTGTGGTIDTLASSSSFAIVPGYQAAFAPYYSSTDYVNGNLAVGEQVYLNASNGLPAGVYTLLPARYALLPGAFLITPESAASSLATVAQPNGSSVVSGYEFNGLNSGRTAQPLLSSFIVDPPAVVAASAAYDVLSANTFLSQSAAAAGQTVPQLPKDAGQLILAATQTLNIAGTVNSQPGNGGLGGLVDIASPSAILISGPNTDLATVPGSTLVLSSSGLSAFGADTLLIGGYSQAANGGYSVVVTTNSLTVDNAGASVSIDGQTLNGLSAPDIVLVSNETLTLAPGAEVIQSTPTATSSPLALSLTGDGAFLRVSSSQLASTTRSGVNPLESGPALIIGSDVTITGENGSAAGSVTLDSTFATSLDPTALINATTVNLDSGQISIELMPPSVAPNTTGLILSGSALSNLQASAETLSLLSYSSIDIYGSGEIGGSPVSGQYPVANLELHTGEIRGFSNGGTVSINANDVTLDNSPNGTAPGVLAASSGNLTINAATIELGTNQLDIDQFSNVTMNASSGIVLAAETKVAHADTTVVNGTGGVAASNALILNTPVITAAAFTSTQAPGNETITATDGNLAINNTETSASSITEGLGATLTVVGQSVSDNSTIVLPSGKVTLHATSGDVSVGGTLNVAGTAQVFNDVTEFTTGGQITMTSDAGSVNIASGSRVDVSANAGGGNAGTLSVNAAAGTFTFAANTMFGEAGTGGHGGTFSLNVGTLAGGNLQPLDSALNAGGFTQSISIRDETDANVLVNGTVTAGSYNLSVDNGSITVNGTIDASDVATLDPNGNPILVGGTIDLAASGSITLAPGSILTVAAQNFDNGGQGGSVSLTAGAETNGNFVNTTLNTSTATGPLIDIEAGSTIDLSVAAQTAGSAAQGDLAGTLIISAPQTLGNTDLQIAPINGTILNASSITVEGNQVFVALDGSIDNQEGNVMSNGETFAGNTGAILSRLFNSNTNGAAYKALTNVEPGAEIVSLTGNLTLASNWDLSTYRFGPNVVAGVDGSGAAGILTLRAADNIIFDFGASLSDGFDPANTSFAPSSNPMWTAPLLPAGDQSWTYQIVAGADFSGANVNDVQSPAELQALGLGGSVLVGAGAPALPTKLTGGEDTRSFVVANLGYFQVIRTGTGNITIDAGGDVQLINNLATIYTAGTQASTLNGFVTPTLPSTPQTPGYGAQYSLDGGNVTISAQGNIAHLTATGLPDSSKELPNNWLYRQGSVDSTGDFVKATSWWIDFSNFFEGVGALGGGNVTLIAGGSVNNVDAVVPTNERTTSQTTLANGTTSTLATDQTQSELGGGNLTVFAGDNINGGVYYVERGQGTLAAGNQILTNVTRAAVRKSGNTSQSITWLPTTLFLGDGSFNVSAGSDLLLGPVANPFLLPQGTNNSFQNKSYFSTYAGSDAIDVSSLAGTVTFKDSTDNGTGSLEAWYNNVVLATNGLSIASAAEPWLNSAETSFTPFITVAALMPPTLNGTAFSGDIDVAGSLTLSPSSIGTINLLAADSLNGFQINDAGAAGGGGSISIWGSSVINLSDADPASIPGVTSPLSNSIATTNTGILNSVNSLFAESGATEGLVLQTKDALHAKIDGNVLHADDPNPVHLFAQTGNISGVTLFSGKASQIVAGKDITDIAFYIQNVSATDVSVVAAGRDIIAYDPESSLRLDAAAPGNSYIGQTVDDLMGTGLGGPNAGDIQIGGPGTLEVLAGRNLNLGVGPNNANGTGTGISSIGNTSDAYLPFGGADIIAGAGMGGSAGLDDSLLNFGNVGFVNGDVTVTNPATFNTSFIGQFLSPTVGGEESAIYLPELGALMNLPSSDSDAQIWTAFSQKSAQNQDTLALDIFYLVLRDAGRNHNNGTGTSYASGNAAIKALFPGTPWPLQGDISLTSREIVTTNGGNINLLAPGGQLTVGFDIAGNQALDQGILTEDGGNISIFTNSDVNVGTSRIFTLNGGNEIIWSTNGDIAAGNSSKTVQSAPPTRVLVDPQSGSVETDLAGLATGGGIGVLETVVGAPPSDVDLIAQNGTVNAGDAGIRVSGNLNIAAVQVLNAGNIQVGGKSAGVPTVSTPNIAGLSAASSATGAASNAATQAANQGRNQVAQQQEDLPSIITVEVLGYGGGNESQD
jgi:filamentous hemagglutinin